MQRICFALCFLVSSNVAVVLHHRSRNASVLAHTTGNASVNITGAHKVTNTNGSQLPGVALDGGESSCPSCPCQHPKPTPPHKWAALTAMINALNAMQAPYNIHGGTLLGLVRGCNIFDSDIDFVIEGWWLSQNHQAAENAFAAAGFRNGDIFGTLGQKGYEEAQVHKLQSFSQMNMQRTKHLVHKDGMKVDIFTIQRYPDKYVWGLWVDGEYHPCTTMSTGVAGYNWLGLNVRIPVPTEVALSSLYGFNYMTPRSWTWNVEPFTVGSCEGAPVPAVVPSDTAVTAVTAAETEEEIEEHHAEEVRSEARWQEHSDFVARGGADKSIEEDKALHSEPEPEPELHVHEPLESEAEAIPETHDVSDTSEAKTHKEKDTGFWGMLTAFWGYITGFFNSLKHLFSG